MTRISARSTSSTGCYLLLLGTACLALLGGTAVCGAARPNFVVIFIDDMGYGDVGPFGSTVNQTPHLDRMAAEGMRLTSFYAAASVCTPSRAALLTGCYPRRVGLGRGSWHAVLMPGARRGLHPDEITIAEVLRGGGYVTGCFGKWHLGDHPDFLPLAQGFDTYYGIPYSNDMWPGLGRREFPRLPLVRDATVVGEVSDMGDQADLCRLFTDEAIGFIRAHKDEPFFAYVPHAFIHSPRSARADFLERTRNPERTTGAQIEEVDASVGRILDTLRELDLAAKTLVFFTSDNGGCCGSVNAPLRGKKGTTWEGGMRVPAIAWQPGTVPAGADSDEIMTTMDLLPTFANLAGLAPPADRAMDGRDVANLLLGSSGATSPHEAFLYYSKDRALDAIRAGRWKLRRGELYDLEKDIGETTNVAAARPDVVARLERSLEEARQDLGDGPRRGLNTRPVGVTEHPRSLSPRFPGERSTWYGFERYDFSTLGFAATVVAPVKLYAQQTNGKLGRHWIWRARFFGHEPQTDLALLEEGFHLVYADVANLYGSPRAMERLDTLYRYVVGEHGFAPKPALEGMSRGGLTTYNWATRNPEKVACIYADNPVCDFKSWPAGRGNGKGSLGAWKKCLDAYGFTEEQALAYEGNPLDHLAPLAEAKVPLLHICGTADEVVRIEENTEVLAERYRALGGTIAVIRKEGVGHHPHSLKDPQPIVDFILEHTLGRR